MYNRQYLFNEVPLAVTDMWMEDDGQFTMAKEQLYNRTHNLDGSNVTTMCSNPAAFDYDFSKHWNYTFTEYARQLFSLTVSLARACVCMCAGAGAHCSLLYHTRLFPRGVQGWRACPHAQPECPTSRRKAAPLTILLITGRWCGFARTQPVAVVASWKRWSSG
jgi:hypothetical protein